MRVANNPDEVEILKEEAEADLKSALNAIKLKDRGEHLAWHLRTSNFCSSQFFPAMNTSSFVNLHHCVFFSIIFH